MSTPYLSTTRLSPSSWGPFEQRETDTPNLDLQEAPEMSLMEVPFDQVDEPTLQRLVDNQVRDAP